jgi:uncharacterized protein (TIGR02466 family)
MAQIYAIFPTLISLENLDDFKCDHQKIYEKTLEWRDNYPNKRQWNCYTSIGYDLVINEPLFEKILYVCTQKVRKFSENFMTKKKPILQGAWININNQGHSQEFHVHPECAFSAVYYIKVNADSGNLEFLNSAEMFGEPGNIYLKTRKRYKPCEGDLVIFRSTTPHRVLINKTAEDRVSLAMNFILE